MTYALPMQNQNDHWQQALKEIVTDFDELASLLEWDAATIAKAKTQRSAFPLRVPRPFVASMRKNDLADPLLLQVMVQHQENIIAPGFSEHPLQEHEFNPMPGLLHKYRGRVLLITTGACAINCRYCFRRHFPYSEQLPNKQQWQAILDYIASDETIEEVILSGGEPLLLKDDHIQRILQDLEAIKQVKFFRIHSRMPVVIPSRITDEFIHILQNTTLTATLVLHSNHPNEVSACVAQAMRRLSCAGITLLNQFVLLKSINDDADVIAQLSKTLYQCGVLPYYCHLLDPVIGATHFFVAKSEAVRILQQCRERLPGYLVPRLVVENPGATSKTPV